MIANRVRCYVHLLVAELKPNTLPTTPLFITLKLSRLLAGNKKNVANSTCWGIWIILNACWCTFLHFVKLLLPHYAGLTLAQRLHGAHKVLGSRLVTLGSRECSWFRPGGKINISINSLGIKGTRLKFCGRNHSYHMHWGLPMDSHPPSTHHQISSTNHKACMT